MMRDIIENQANELRLKVWEDYKSEAITKKHYQKMMQFIEEIECEGNDLSVIKMLHTAKMTYIIMK